MSVKTREGFREMMLELSLETIIDTHPRHKVTNGVKYTSMSRGKT